MLQEDGKEWTVKKRQLLGKHIVAMEIASAEFSQTVGVQPKVSTQWKPHSSGKSTASGLIAGNSKHKGAPKPTEAKCAFCSQSLMSVPITKN